MHAIRIHEFGGPDVMLWEEVEVGDPGPGEARLRQTAVGLNYIDTYHRRGLYPVDTPFTPGLEHAGTVETVFLEVSLGFGFQVCPKMHPGRIKPDHEGLTGLVGALHEVQGQLQDLFVDGLHTLLGERPRVLDASVGITVNDPARPETLLEGLALRIKGIESAARCPDPENA